MITLETSEYYPPTYLEESRVFCHLSLTGNLIASFPESSRVGPVRHATAASPSPSPSDHVSIPIHLRAFLTTGPTGLAIQIVAAVASLVSVGLYVEYM